MSLLRVIFSLIFFLGYLAGYAQTLRGIVTAHTTGEPLYPAVITNTQTGKSVYADENGKYSILATAGDKIAVYFVGYTTTQWIMTATLGSTIHNFELKPLSQELSEVVIRKKNYTQYQIDSMERRSVYARALAREKGGSLMSPFTLLGEKLSKSSKEIFRFQKDFQYWEKQKYIDVRYDPELVKELTNLSGDTLAHFMNAYPVPYDYARTATELEFKMWIRTNFKEWIKTQADTTTNQ